MRRVDQIMTRNVRTCRPGDALSTAARMRDICMAGYTQGHPLSAIRVGGAAGVLRQRQIRRLPVVDNGDHLVGMLSLADAAREAVREHGRKGRDVTDTRIGEVLEAICVPRSPHELAQTGA